MAWVGGVVGGLGVWAFSRVNAALQAVATESLPALVRLVEAERDTVRRRLAEKERMLEKAEINAAGEYRLRMSWQETAEKSEAQVKEVRSRAYAMETNAGGLNIENIALKARVKELEEENGRLVDEYNALNRERGEDSG